MSVTQLHQSLSMIRFNGVSVVLTSMLLNGRKKSATGEHYSIAMIVVWCVMAMTLRPGHVAYHVVLRLLVVVMAGHGRGW